MRSKRCFSHVEKAICPVRIASNVFSREKNDTSSQKPQRFVSFALKFFAVFRRLHRPHFASCFADIQKKRPIKAKFFSKKIVKNRDNCVGIVLCISHYRWRKLKGAGKTTVKGEKTEQDVSLYLNFLLELSLSSHMLLFIFKPVILLKIVHFYLYVQKKVNITCNSWITSYPYPH